MSAGLSDTRRAEIEALAIQAEADNPSPWVPYFTVHGDPYVNLSPGRGLTSIGHGTVCTVSTCPDDYGKSTAEHIAACDPATVIALIQERDALAAQVDRLLPIANAAERQQEQISALTEAAVFLPTVNGAVPPTLDGAMEEAAALAEALHRIGHLIHPERWKDPDVHFAALGLTEENDTDGA